MNKQKSSQGHTDKNKNSPDIDIINTDKQETCFRYRNQRIMKGRISQKEMVKLESGRWGDRRTVITMRRR